ncbi:MAG: hypothetical protein VB046_09695 [Paludibacter sp.]|nr:hypothetical protein [Paludibacter sp.]
MSPNIPREKPKTGRLWYGGRLIAQNEPFRNLQYRKIQLIREGYDKKLFRISY